MDLRSLLIVWLPLFLLLIFLILIVACLYHWPGRGTSGGG